MSAQEVPSIMDQETYDSLARNLRDAGYTPEQIEGWNTAGRLHELHKFARVNRVRNVRSVPELMEQAYTDAYTWRHGRPPQAQAQQQQHTSMQAREQRKEQLQNQPAARRMSPGLQPQKQQSTVTQDRKSAFQQMRESRGFGRG